MKTDTELRSLLRSIDHKSYPAYKSLAGAYRFRDYVLVIDHVQGDPFASPSSLHVEVSHGEARFPQEYYREDCSRIALQDYLVRRLSEQFEQYNFKAKGSGKSGLLSISRCGQEVLERSACQITEKGITVRFHAGFPAFGRTINAGELEKILFEFLPRSIGSSLFFGQLAKPEQEKVKAAVWLAEDQTALRKLLREEKLVAFVANGAVLPRKSGVSDKPMTGSVPFESPKSMERTFHLPHRGDITGMAVPEGITLIVGGGYHGKSTLLEAIQMGVYNHISGDGREFVLTEDTAVKLRAEDGRSVRNVDISLFINDLPNKKDTTSFTTEDASGSTSQAAGVVESMEAGSRLFLIDEDTSATNFMVRDEFMQQVIRREKEPITPFLERARDLYEQAGISTILVAGSSGAFFYIADWILCMDCYRPVDITAQVKELCREHAAPRTRVPGFAVPEFKRVLPAYGKSGSRGRADLSEESVGEKAGGGSCVGRGRQGGEAYRGRGGRPHEHMKVKSFGLESFSLEKENINVRYLEQLTDNEQTTALAYLLRDGLEQTLDGRHTVRQVVQTLMNRLESQGWEPFCSSYIPCGLARPRIQELYACLNRFRG